MLIEHLTHCTLQIFCSHAISIYNFYVSQKVKLYIFSAFQVFISVSVILGDGLYNLIKIIYATIKEIMNARAKKGRLPLVQVQDGMLILILYFLFYTSMQQDLMLLLLDRR